MFICLTRNLLLNDNFIWVFHVFTCCCSTLITPVELVVHQDSQAPFHRAALWPGRSWSVLHSWIMSSWVQDLTLVLVELHQVRGSPLFQTIQAFPQGGSLVWSAHFLTPFGIISKLRLATLDPLTQVTYGDIKQCWGQYSSLEDLTCARLPVWKRTVEILCKNYP